MAAPRTCNTEGEIWSNSVRQIQKYKTSDKLFETAITPNEHTAKRYNAGLCIFHYPFHYFPITCAWRDYQLWAMIYAPEDCWWPESVPLTGEILQLVLRDPLPSLMNVFPGCLASNRNSVITTTTIMFGVNSAFHCVNKGHRRTISRWCRDWSWCRRRITTLP